MKYRYEFTGQMAESLFESIPERHFEKMVEDQADYYYKASTPNGEWRQDFIEGCLWEEVEDLKEQGLVGKRVTKKWLDKHECPDVDEDGLRLHWSCKKADWDAQDGILWEECKKDDDAATALAMGYVKYPGFDKEMNCYVDGQKEGPCIPADVANRISEINRQMSKLPRPAYTKVDGKNVENLEHKKLRLEMNRLERDAVESLILVDAYTCGYCGCEVELHEYRPMNALPRHSACNEVFCDSCIGAYPKSVEASRELFRDLLNGDPSVSCHYCGGNDYRFLVEYLTVFKFPIPEEFKDKDDFLVMQTLLKASRKEEEVTFSFT